MASEHKMRPLRVLVTNNTLDQRAGSELYVRDLALALVRLGNLPVVYSPVLGPVAEELERATIPVIDNLDNLGSPPDIIHGHHHHETMTAGLRFPDRPMIYVCHGWLPWEERPPLFPTIRRYVAVDDLCRERLLTAAGIDEAKVTTIYNFADVDRFRQRPPLPERPRSALIFSNYTSGMNEEIRAACRAIGIEQVDLVGNAAGNPTALPEELLQRYDIVFAKGRSAIEALVCGCAVVVADYSRFAGLVTSRNLDELRRLNFGVRTLQHPITHADLRPVLEQYDAVDAHAVSAKMRAEATLTGAVERYVSLYREVLDGWDAARDAPAAQEAIAYAARYLRWLSPTIKDRWHVQQHARRMESEVQALRETGERSSARLSVIEDEYAALAREIEEARIHMALGEQELADLRNQLADGASLLAERDLEAAAQARATEQASTYLAGCRQEIARLERALTELKAKDVSARLLLREQELANIKASRAWKAVQSYGRLKKILVR
jgi:hypothetical protein